MTNEEFIKKANFVHNNYFSYNNCNYTGSNNKVIITCPVHGDFSVKDNNHLNGYNCKKCSREGIFHKITKLEKVNSSTKKLTTKEFIQKAKDKWGNKYQYEHTKYEKNNKPVIITCPIHGDFSVTPNHFLGNRGCPKCGKNYRYTNDEFISKLKIINGNRYTYKNVKYTTTHSPVIVTCTMHGDFMNQPSNLLKGQGCPICNESLLEKSMSEILKSIGLNFEREKRFTWLGRQSIDFYIENLSIGVECQGIQHFENVPFFKKTDIKNQELLDNIKKEKCKNHNIRILYYSNIDKYIDNINIFDESHIKNILVELIDKSNDFGTVFDA